VGRWQENCPGELAGLNEALEVEIEVESATDPVAQ